jgi:hypothetical protein
MIRVYETALFLVEVVIVARQVLFPRGVEATLAI